MKRHKHQTQKTNYILIASIAIIVLIGAILLFSGNNDSKEDDQLLEQDANQDQVVLEDEFIHRHGGHSRVDDRELFADADDVQPLRALA